MGPPESVKKLASRPKVNTIVITAKPTSKNNQGLIVPTRETTIDGNVNIPAPIMALMARRAIPKEPTERISLFLLMSKFRGSVYGHFFGPGEKEIGGVIKFMDVEESKFTTAYGVISFAGAMN